MLDGQKSKIDPIIVPMPLVTQEDLPGLFKPCMSPTSTDKYPVVKEDPLPTKLMDEYFEGKGEVGKYDCSALPGHCDGAA